MTNMGTQPQRNIDPALRFIGKNDFYNSNGVYVAGTPASGVVEQLARGRVFNIPGGFSPKCEYFTPWSKRRWALWLLITIISLVGTYGFMMNTLHAIVFIIVLFLFLFRKSIKYTKAKKDISAAFSAVLQGATIEDHFVDEECRSVFGAVGEIEVAKALADKAAHYDDELVNNTLKPMIVLNDIECINGGRVSANIDHLLLCGTGFVMVDAKAWSRDSLKFQCDHRTGDIWVDPNCTAATAVSTCLYESAFVPEHPEAIVFAVSGGGASSIKQSKKYFASHNLPNKNGSDLPAIFGIRVTRFAPKFADRDVFWGEMGEDGLITIADEHPPVYFALVDDSFDCAMAVFRDVYWDLTSRGYDQIDFRIYIDACLDSTVLNIPEDTRKQLQQAKQLPGGFKG